MLPCSNRIGHGRFAGRTNEWCVKVFKACDDDILNALESLGHRDLTHEGIDQFDRYTPKVYTKVIDFRWLLCSNLTAEEESLLPTTGSLTMHIQQAHYVAMIWRKAVESHPSLPPPVDCVWEFDTTRHLYT